MGGTNQTWMGIDFGTCRSSAAVLIGHDPQPVNLGYQMHGSGSDMPTAVFIEHDGTILVGEEALNARIKDSSRYIDRFKLKIGSHRGVGFPVAGRIHNYSWKELIAPVLKRIRVTAEAQYNNGQPLTKVILTVPAIYVQGGPQWVVMEEAAKQAGFSSVRVVREPHAAAVYYDHVMRQAGLESDGMGKITLVYDLGGGTFDPALIRRQAHGYEIVGAIAGAEGVPCGGIFFDEKIREDFISKCPAVVEFLQAVRRTTDGSVAPDDAMRARRQAKDAMDLEKFLTAVKHRFAAEDVHEVNEPEPLRFESDYRLTRTEFYSLIEPMLDATVESCQKLIQRSKVDWQNITRIIMVDGSCHIPLVREKLQELARSSGQREIEICFRRIGQTDRLVDPLLAVSLGAALALDGAAMCELGDNHYFGYHGVAQDYQQAVAWYRKAAEQGHQEAQRKLGKCCLIGLGTALNHEEASTWYRRAAEQGFAEAQYDLAELQRSGQTSNEISEETAQWYRKAAAQGHADAQYKFGECCDNGNGVPQDHQLAAQLFQMSAEQGHVDAQYKFARHCELGNPVEAMEWYRRAAAQGHGEAQSKLGLYYFSVGDYTLALPWLQKSAAQGLAPSECYLGLCYLSGLGIGEDHAQAITWLRKGADQGFANAQYTLGFCYCSGLGVTKDHSQAVVWFRKAAEQGFADAQYYLGLSSFSGLGVTKDHSQATLWFRKAAEQGFPDAQNALGARYSIGEGVVRDFDEAIKWFRKSADAGNAAAMDNLGYLYAFGRGVAKDRAAARQWYLQAATAGSDNGERYILELSILTALESSLGTMTRTYFHPNIPSAKLVNVRTVYALKEKETVLQLYDDTMFGGAKEGFIVTTYGIGCKEISSTPLYWSFSTFDVSSLTKVLKSLVYGDDMVKQLISAHLPEIARNAAKVWPDMAHTLVESWSQHS
jgi:TPR repeat protein